MKNKVAVILFNLGGPDNLDAVKPFLFNLFNDKAIIDLPNPFRYFIAKLISTRRTPIAKEIYEFMGGKSPILEETIAQSGALEKQLNEVDADNEYKVFISMRYWKPFSYEAISDVIKYSPDKVILLPLYPQYSKTTTGSSFLDWEKVSAKNSFNVDTVKIRNYHLEENFIEAHSDAIKEYYEKASKIDNNVRVLFSAHGLPKKVINQGDPYQREVEDTVDAIVKKMGIDGLDYVVCYQSRVGPLEWIGPSTDDEIKRAGKDSLSLVVIPIAFVSEHSETLVELDIEYKELAEESGVKNYHRVPALGVSDKFIKSLVSLCLKAN